MARPKYIITKQDVAYAKAYIQHLRPHQVDESAMHEFRVATDHRKSAVSQAKEVNAWCERHFTSDEWHKLKLSIRKKRERARTEKKTITISVAAFKKLKALAERDGVTYSACLEGVRDMARKA